MPNPWTETGDPVDRCADLPDAPTPEPFRPPPGTYARHGRKKSKNLYLVTPDSAPEGLDIGRLDTPEMAALVVEALNHYLLGTGHRWEYGVEGRWPDGTTHLDWRRSQDEAEDVLAARGQIEGNVVESRLVRRLHTIGCVEEVSEDA